MSDWALAVDIGGTKLAVARVTAEGRVSVRAQAPTPATDDADIAWSVLRSLIADVCGGEQPVAVGVGCGGPMRWPEGVVSPLNIPAFREFPLRERLRAEIGNDVVRVHNDAVAMAVGEHWQGAGVGVADMLGMVVSTGVGGGIISGGRLIDGGTGNAGHIGHVVVDADGPPCACGGRGCLEAVARGPAVVAWAMAQGWSPPEGIGDGPSLVAAAHDGDAIALAALTRAGRAIGVAVASAAVLLDVDLVVVGGGLANAGDLLLTPASAAYERHARLDFSRRVRWAPAKLGADAGLIGAAAFVLAAESYWPAAAD